MGLNGARGETAAMLAGAERRLCLTLGALAERMRALSGRDLMAVLAALLRGGGERELAAGLERAEIDPRAAAEAVVRAFAASA